MLKNFKIASLSFLLFLMGVAPLPAQEKPIQEKPNSVLLDVPDYNPGFFSIVNSIFGALNEYEKGELNGLHVNLTRGIYHDPNIGPNFWEYFFEPIALGKSSIQRSLTTDELRDYGMWTFYNLDRNEGYRLIEEYMHLKPNIKDEICKLQTDLFGEDYVIGVHYRGTDKVIQEASRIEYYTVLEKIKEVISQIPPNFQNNYRVFVATDEQPFLEYLKASLACPVVYLEAVRVGSEPWGIHYRGNYESPYQKGREALFDAMLLAESHFLIRTVSNLSFFSERKNPNLPVILLK